ncbi:hypothetical protein [Rahnella victoriana]|uniref:hypothetical protein n=1 Tax=Rahnella victoriana TaxID=1510570 RepID=UPI0010403736|nr:hypothetical protein [Rahnella victoriana]TBX30801.1 hypothetical protein EYY67_23725 [Rahnella victoriana]
MKDNYCIPGFEPDEIRDMAKSALKQIHERRVSLVEHENEDPNRAALDMRFVNLNEPYVVLCGSNETNLIRAQAAVVSAGYESFRQHPSVTDGNQKYEVGVTIHEFDRQLDSAGHGKNVSVGTASSSEKVAQ